MKGHIPKGLKPSHITAVVDTREQKPLDLPGLKNEVGTLTTGDYSVLGLEDLICVERKSLSDFVGCVNQGRERFARELKRMLSYPYRVVVFEFTQERLEQGNYPKSKVTAASAMGSLIRWAGTGIHFQYAGDPVGAAKYTANFLFLHARLIHEQRLNFVLNEETETVDATDQS